MRLVLMEENKQKDPLNRIFTIPNILSTIRILLIPVFLWLYIAKEEYLYATILIIALGVSDVIDGYIARTFNQISRLGKILDPTADKLMQAAILAALMIRFPYMLIVFVVLALKESIMLALGAIFYKHTKRIEGSRWHGKLSAVVVYIMLLTHLLWGINSTIPTSISYTTTILAIAAMIFSLIMYIRDYIILYKEHNIIESETNS
jgi:cardiolipin synthase